MRKNYGEKEQERLDDTPEEVIERVFDDPETIKNYAYPFVVYEFEPMKVEIDSESVLEGILETLDDEYGDPDGDYTKPTEKMKVATEEFLKVIKSEYYTYMCKPTGNKIEYFKHNIQAVLRGAR